MEKTGKAFRRSQGVGMGLRSDLMPRNSSSRAKRKSRPRNMQRTGIKQRNLHRNTLTTSAPQFILLQKLKLTPSTPTIFTKCTFRLFRVQQDAFKDSFDFWGSLIDHKPLFSIDASEGPKRKSSFVSLGCPERRKKTVRESFQQRRSNASDSLKCLIFPIFSFLGRYLK